MSIQLPSYVFSRHNKHQLRSSTFLNVSASSFDFAIDRATFPKTNSTCFDEAKERISKLILKPEFSVSTYDTAWVSMVPSPNSPKEPYFPNSLNWLIENQCQNGSWARPHHHSLLQKDVLSSTLACVLALKRWGVGEEHINRGLRFLELNFASVSNESQISPLGFNIIFPGMIQYARDLSLNLNLESNTVNDLIRNRDSEIKRCRQSGSKETDAYLAYISEGIGKLQDWESVMKYQRKNGSLFNSPSTTASAYIFHHNVRCLDYLHSALNKFGNAVPTVYPLNIYAQLSTIDNLERLGISRFFMNGIQSVLEATYRWWLQGEEEIFMDASTCALAFRLLRMNGYDVNSDKVTKILEDESLSTSLCGPTRDIHRILESYKASEICIYPDESLLEMQNLKLKDILERKLADGLTYSSEICKSIEKEVDHVLQYPFYAILKRMANRRNIEHYSLDDTRILKTSYCSPNFGNKDFSSLSVADYNKCQNIHREELKELERWVVENRLEELKFARSKSAYNYFSAAATIFSPELSDARIAWAKNGVLATVVDDFFDIGGSINELKNLIQLVEEWDVNVSTECSSENVLILFSALKGTICDIGEKAFLRQERNVTNHIKEIWLDLLNSMLKETEWARDKYVPTMEEYMSNAYVSFALGPVAFPALYLVGPKVSEEMVQSFEYHNLYKLMSTCGRLLNDINSYEREMKDGKLNAISLYMMINQSCDDITKETAVDEMRRLIDNSRRKLLGLVLEGNKSLLPRDCKDLFWYICTVVHIFYFKDDGFTSSELMKVVTKIIHEPVVLDELYQ